MENLKATVTVIGSIMWMDMFHKLIIHTISGSFEFGLRRLTAHRHQPNFFLLK